MERSGGGREGGVSYPQIANAVYISRRNAAYYNALCAARITSKDSGGEAAAKQGRNSTLLRLWTQTVTLRSI